MNGTVATLGELIDVWEPGVLEGFPTCVLNLVIFKCLFLFQLFDLIVCWWNVYIVFVNLLFVPFLMNRNEKENFSNNYYIS